MVTQRQSFSSRLRVFAVVSTQMTLVLLLVWSFGIEEQKHFFSVLCLAAGGFVVHAWLPERLRAGFFALLSLAGIVLVLGGFQGAAVIGLGVSLIAVCHLPLPVRWRAVLLLLAGVVLAMCRVDYPAPFWPVLGSMFMFRLLVYLYEIRHERGRPSALTLGYFFALPNVCFLFFPILDYKTWRTSYRANALEGVAQEGIAWISRGLVHLLAYRVVKYYLLPAPAEVKDVPHLTLFLATNYALYLHVSGTFHLITGILHLFGYGLPRTHNNYFLASSFTDIWRRINVYWTSFMMKLFFNPAVYALRRWGLHFAVAAAALGVFLMTWLLHVYQAFWITGSLPLSLYEASLWLGVGILVAINLQFDLTRASRPAPGGRDTSLRAAIDHSLRVVGMFVLVSLFWACWNTPGVFRSAVERLHADDQWLTGSGLVMAVLLSAVGIGVLVQLAQGWRPPLPVLQALRSPTASLLGLTILALLGTSPGAGVIGSRTADLLASLRQDAASRAEAGQAVMGYYEELTATRVPTGALLALLERQPLPARGIGYDQITRPADALVDRELIPNWSGEIMGSPLSINRFGMRDRPERSQAKLEGVCRIAMIGSSVVMGYRVGDTETFPYLLEERFNARRRDGDPRWEFLNFGTGRSYVIQRRALIDRKVWGFQPDVLCYVAHQDEFAGAIKNMTNLIAQRAELYPCLREVVQKAGIRPDTSDGMAEALLQPLARDIVLGMYRELLAACRQRKVGLIWMYVPVPGVSLTEEPPETFVAVAREAGLRTINLAGWHAGYTPTQFGLSPVEPHPNALGQRVLAERIDDAFRHQPDLLPACGHPN
jgi:hypothetical protein